MAAVSYLYHYRPEREEKKVVKPKPSLALGRQMSMVDSFFNSNDRKDM